uniref:PDZK1-interacting protein 1 n=1 Tax=Myotis myotis TaxID=51298 RepID=A0A7J8A053_MYOMY|nr:PDZK1 interacting protein 1 [Myotis myotis]
MSALSLLILGLLSAVPPASCQQGLGNLQPWMQGLIAMAVFLVLVAIAFAVNHFWCQERKGSIPRWRPASGPMSMRTPMRMSGRRRARSGAPPCDPTCRWPPALSLGA